MKKKQQQITYFELNKIENIDEIPIVFNGL